MKVSAPTAPVPESPAPVPPESATTGATEPVPPVAAEEPAAPIVLARWPEWYRPVDIALGILVAVLAFLLASHIARNSDIWRHMGTGRLIVQGQYPIGGDPLSFTGADAARSWVNSNWLFDVVMYVAYSADETGVTSVIIKASAFAAAFALLFLLRKPDQALWPWAVMAGLGAIATGSQASLRPHTFAMLFEAIVLVLIYRGKWAESKWRMPAIFGGVCWLWACTDTYYLLGPLTLGFVWLGEYLQGRLMPGQPAPDGSEDPFWAPPPRDALLRGLLLGIAGALLNPMFLGALVRSPLDALGQLIPFELTFGWEEQFAGDLQLVGLSLSPTNSHYFEGSDRGDNVTGYCALALFIAGGLLLGVGFSRLRVTQVVLWFGFILLTLLHYRFIPLTAIVVIPLAAGHLNGLSRFRLGGTFDPKTKLILNLSGIGRIFSVAIAIFLIAETVPGHLHAKVSQTALAYNRRVSWGIEEDAGLSRGAKLIAQWRADGSLSPESRALTSYFDFGDYCAWHAPGERVFINSRFRYHKDELLDLAAIRKELRDKSRDTRADANDSPLKAMADKYRADLYVLGQWLQRMRIDELIRLTRDFDRGGPRTNASTNILHLDGRLSIIGRLDTPSGLATAKRISFSPEREAFSPYAPAVPDGEAKPPKIAVESWIAEYLDQPQLGSLSTDDALIFVAIGKYATLENDQIWAFLRERAVKSGWAAGPAIQSRFEPPPRSLGGDELAYPILANRAVRRAIAETPDDPEPYHALAEVYTLGAFVPTNPEECQLQQMTALRRFLDRLPTSPNRGDSLQRWALDDSLTLFLLHIDMVQYDSALELLTKTNAKITGAPDADLPTAARMQQVSEVFRSRFLEMQFGLPRNSLRAIINAPDGGIAEVIANYILQIAQANGQRPSNDEAQRFYKEILSKVTGTSLDAGDKSDKSKPKDAAWVKSRFQAIEDRLKREVGLRIERHGAGKSGIGQKFYDAVKLGLPARAIDLINAESDWSNVTQSSLDIRIPESEYQQARQRYDILFDSAATIQKAGGGFVLVRATDLGLNLQAVQLQLQCGKLDTAALDLNAIKAIVDKLEQDKPSDPRLIPSRAAIKQLQAYQARLTGNFSVMAADTREQLQKLPKLPPATLAQFQIPYGELHATLTALCGQALVIPDPLGRERAILRQEASLHYDLGMTALMAGDNKEARVRFAMVLNPQGVPFRVLNFDPDSPHAMYSSLYLRLLVRFAEKPKP